ncbi:MAG: hypothetical protein M3Z01_06765 [Thermoproteota archaeon]|nr:hypothetical protein [Thermoproteota archaeon]
MQQSIVILVHDIIKTIVLESNQVLHVIQTKVYDHMTRCSILDMFLEHLKQKGLSKETRNVQ